MSTERDFDRIARAWLEMSPTEAPDRAIAAALDAIEATPQVRRPLRWPFWRPSPMTRLPLLAALAGVIIVLAATLLLSGGGGPTPGPSTVPSPTPSAVVTASPTPGPLPEAVLGGWVGASRGTETEANSERSFLVFGPQGGSEATFALEVPGRTSTLPAVAGSSGADELVLQSDNQQGGCTSGDLGRYRWATTADDQWLTVTLIDDECDVRAQILPGTWQRSVAHYSTGGPMVAAVFDPVFTVTLPPGDYAARGASVLDTVVMDASTYTFKVWKDVDGFVDPCDIDAGRIDLEGLDDVLAYFTGDPRFEVTRQEEFTIDGRRAVELGLLIGPDQTKPCWGFDGNTSDPTGVLTFAPHALPGAFWNGKIGDPGLMVVTEVDGISLLMEPVTFDGDVVVDRATLETIRFLDELPTPPGG